MPSKWSEVIGDEFIPIEHFTPDEWEPGALEHIDPKLVVALDRFRALYRSPVYPSKAPGAWFRTDERSSSSRHYAVGRQSDAGDCFLGGDVRDAFHTATGMKEFGGVGLYFDTFYMGKTQAMIHLDLREVDIQMWWARIQGQYFYAHKSGEKDIFYKALAGSI